MVNGFPNQLQVLRKVLFPFCFELIKLSSRYTHLFSPFQFTLCIPYAKDDRAVMWGSPRSPSSNNSYPYTPPHEEPYTPPHEEEEPYTPPHDEEGSRSPQPGPSGLGRSGRRKRSRSSSGHKSRKVTLKYIYVQGQVTLSTATPAPPW